MVSGIIDHLRGKTNSVDEEIQSVTANSLKSQNGTLFSHVWRRGRLALDPFRVFFSGI